MRRLLSLALTAGGLLGGAPAGARDAASEAAVRAIVAEQAAAWNAGDGAGYARHPPPDVSFTNLCGMVMCGAPAFAARHPEVLATFYRGTTKRHGVRRVCFVTPAVAIVGIDNEVHGVRAMQAGIALPPDGVLRTQLMEVFVRRGRARWVEAYHNADVKPVGSREACPASAPEGADPAARTGAARPNVAARWTPPRRYAAGLQRARRRHRAGGVRRLP